MNPNQNPLPGNTLPSQPNVAAGPSTTELGAEPYGEMAPSSAPVAPPPAAAASWLPPTVPLQASSGSDGSTASTIVSVPTTADDGDVIEKEWVLKARQIVERTKQDPHMQTKEMHKFKAEYMKKRYNKIIEPVEE